MGSRKARKLVLVGLVALSLVLAVMPGVGSATVYDVYGVVTDADTMLAIEDASVDLWVSDGFGGWNFVESAYTDLNGYYYFFETLDPAEWYGIDVVAYGYEDYESGEYSGAEAPLLLDVTLDPRVEHAVPVQGPNRIETAIAASNLAFPELSGPVVLATAYNWPDALGGAALAGALGGPILLTPKDALPASVMEEIDRLNAGEVYILGGTGAVSAAVETTLKNHLGAAYVHRIAGVNRYETSRMIADETVAQLGPGAPPVAFVATGLNFPDALGASPIAAGEGWPIYLVPPSGVDDTLVAAIREHAAGVYVLGGSSAVSDASYAHLVAEGFNVARIAGANRYDTARQLAEFAVNDLWYEWDKVAIATGQNFPDALAGGVLQAQFNSVMLLTPSNALNAGVASVLSANKDDIWEVRFLGGPTAVSSGVRTAVQNALQ